jgi:hypothetical protein
MKHLYKVLKNYRIYIACIAWVCAMIILPDDLDVTFAAGALFLD